ncbi:hypothetical protein BaRGS_00006206 [Batillaria attramentaria]|uniref:Uncharacterized protein n=1 Tax=Batillaria attramentaria TaxID=370345 RepID=A0ABD0LT19_9CAEN
MLLKNQIELFNDVLLLVVFELAASLDAKDPPLPVELFEEIVISDLTQSPAVQLVLPNIALRWIVVYDQQHLRCAKKEKNNG